MPAFHTGVVTEVLTEREGLQRVRCDLTEAGREAGEPAYVLSELTGPVRAGDRVVLNTTAVDLGLGTGGWHVVHWNLSRDSWVRAGPGHIMKLRYTSLQVDTGAAEEEHGRLPDDLEGVPVLACGLHSQMACAALAFAEEAPGARLVYVMTDGAALPLAFSDLVHGLRVRGVLHASVTVGNAFGGDLEAVSLPSGLLLARHVLDADAVVVGMGPGVTGTATRYGTTAVEVGSILDTGAALGGRPVMTLRVSSGDPRPRHRGVSHHSLTALELCRSEVRVAVAEPLAGIPERHDTTVVEVPDMAALVARSGLAVTTMGRGPTEDVDFFAHAAAGGVLGARLASERGREAR